MKKKIIGSKRSDDTDLLMLTMTTKINYHYYNDLLLNLYQHERRIYYFILDIPVNERQ